MDFKSAFDRVGHDLLLERLKTVGMSAKSIRIIEIILYNSNFSLDNENYYDILIGAPQGCVIGP